MKTPEFSRFEYFENGEIKTNYHIDGEPKSENAYFTALEYYFEQNKNVHVKPKAEDCENLESKIQIITLHHQYIQALEEDYEESDCESFDDYNQVKERCIGIMDMIQDLKNDIDFLKQSHNKNIASEILKHNAKWFLNIAEEIDKE